MIDDEHGGLHLETGAFPKGLPRGDPELRTPPPSGARKVAHLSVLYEALATS